MTGQRFLFLTRHAAAALLLLFVFQGFYDATVQGCTTNPNIVTLFNSSCYATANRSRMDSGTATGFDPQTVCPAAWNAFMGAFVGKDPTDVNISSYDNYFAQLPVTPGPNEALFWSGTPMITDFVSGMNENICSSFTLASSEIINGLGVDACWCGSASGGIDYTNPCPPNATTSFWASFSCMLGNNAKGTAFWLSWGERPGGTYQPGNFFGIYEFPALQPPRVTKLVVFDVHRHGMGESCGEGSLATLENAAKSRYGTPGYTCYDIFGEAKTNNVTEQRRLAGIIVPIIRKEQQAGSSTTAQASFTAVFIFLLFAVMN